MRNVSIGMLLSNAKMSSINSKRISAFRRAVWKYWRENGRHGLAWRKTKNPYRILVSEVMLQQTQVPRVEVKYREFLKAFPSVRALAKASLADVLRIWSGMGYNRRAKYLRDAARIIVEKHGGNVPRDVAALHALPGIGEYTASAVRVFAFNEPDVLIETNIRAACIHHFFPNTPKVRDSVLLVCAKRAAEGQDPREWHAALMDYGAYLKRSGIRNNHKSAHYTRQSKFEGSLRQIRGAILRELANERSRRSLIGDRKRIQKALEGLARDGLIVKKGGAWRIG